MGRNWALGAAALLMVGVTACGSESADQAGDPAAGGNGTGVGAGVPTGNFLSTEVTEDGKPRKLVKGTLISLRFEDGQVSANAGCNSMSGPARFEGGKLLVSDLATTEMGCPGDGRHEQDQFVAEFLTASPAYTYDGSTLKLNTASVGMVFGPREQVQPDLPLEGTRWNVTHTTQGPARNSGDDPNGPSSAGEAPPNAYLEFAAGRVTGSDGCNSLFGDATISGGTITFGPIGTTKRACPDVLPQHTEAVRAALTGEVEWSIDYNVLHLENADGKGLQLQADEKSGSTSGTQAPDAGTSSGTVAPPCCKPEASAQPAIAEDLPLNVPDDGAPAADSGPAVDPNY